MSMVLFAMAVEHLHHVLLLIPESGKEVVQEREKCVNAAS